MAEIGVKGPELKKLLAVTKRSPLAFAYNPGDKVENDLFALHRKKAADVLGREARKEGKGNKVTFGTAALDGRVFNLTCETVVPGTAKKLKKFLKDQKFSLNVIILDPSGNVLEQDVEALPEDDPFADETEDDPQSEGTAPGETAPEEEPQPDPKERLKALLTRANKIKAGLANAPEAAQAKLKETFERAVTALKGSEFDEAEGILEKLAEVVARLGPAPTAEAAAAPDTPTSPDMAALGTISSRLGERVAALPDGAAKNKLGEAMLKLEGAISGGNVDAAKKAAAAIKTALEKLGVSASAGAGDSAAQTAISTLQTTLVTARTNLTEMQAALRGLGHPEVTRIAEAALSEVRLGDAGPLNSAISAYNSAAPEARPEAAATLATEVRGFREALAGNRIIALCESNPFGLRVSISGPLTQALNGVEAAVSA